MSHTNNTVLSVYLYKFNALFLCNFIGLPHRFFVYFLQDSCIFISMRPFCPDIL